MIDDFKVRDGIWDTNTKIDNVNRKRHTVIFPERNETSKVTFCNNCGSAFISLGRCDCCGEIQE